MIECLLVSRCQHDHCRSYKHIVVVVVFEVFVRTKLSCRHRETGREELLDAALLIFKEDFAENVDGYLRLAAGDQIHALKMIMPQFGEIFQTCRWRNIESKCEELFTKIITAAGICYSFNALSPKDIFRTENIRDDDDLFNTQVYDKHSNWNLENGYTINSVDEQYPRHIVDAQDRLELVLSSAANAKYYNLLRFGPMNGLMIFLNMPGEVPQATEKHISVLHGQEARYSITPKITSSSNNLKYSSLYVRQCFFQHERYLRYFKIYTQTNCELECLSNFTIRMCGCVGFFMPGHSGVPACGSRLIGCMTDAQDSILKDCRCFPTCTLIAYEAEEVAGQNAGHHKKNHKINTNSSKTQHDSKIVVGLYFRDSQFPIKKLFNLYGISDFLADCGGVLCLLMGCSALSLVEIIYFLTLRLLTNLRVRCKKSKGTLIILNKI